MGDHSFVNLQYPKIEILFCRHDPIYEWDHGAKMLKESYWRFYYPFNNAGAITWRGRKIVLETGRFYLIAPETSISSHLIGEMLDKFYVHFLADGEYLNCQNMIVDFPVDPTIRRLVELADEKMQSYRNTPELGMNILALCTAALSMIAPEQMSLAQHVEPKLLDVWRRIQQHPDREYRNEALAAELGISVSAFCRRFLGAFGVPPQQFVLEERLRHAAGLLICTNMSIDEIADKVGFCDRYYFTRAFTKYRQISPAKFRREHH